MRRLQAVSFVDFSGGLNTNTAATSLNTNEASDLQNINLLTSRDPSKVAFEARLGNSEFNSSAMVGSTTAVTGLGYYRQKSGSDFLLATAGAKIFKSDSLDGTMDDITGTVTITSGTNNIWTATTMNDLIIFVGGAPDAPIKFNGTGNAADLGGSPPSGEFGFQNNNYFFIGNTSANPSRIQWSILGNPEDWSGTGSGTQDVSTNDGDQLITYSIINSDKVLLFKQNSIYDLVTRNPPFPLFKRFSNIGCVSKRGAVTVGDITYFITPQPRMKATDGYKIVDFPSTIDDVWDGLNKDRLQYIHGIHYPKLDQIMWFCSNGTSTTNDYCIIWDLINKCWLRHTTGYKMNTSTIAQDYLLKTGAYDGKIYNQDTSNVFADASETSPGAINAYWRTGWVGFESIILKKHIPYTTVNYTTQTSGNFTFAIGFDFDQDRKSFSIDMQPGGGKYGSAIYGTGTYGGISEKLKLLFIKGGGKFTQFLVKHVDSVAGFKFSGFELAKKTNAAERFK